MNFTETSDIGNNLFLPILDTKYSDNIEKLPPHLQKFFSQRILQSSPYTLNKRLNFISTGALGELNYYETQKHFESLNSCPEEFLDKNFLKTKKKSSENLEKKVSPIVQINLNVEGETERGSIDSSSFSNYYSTYFKLLIPSFSGITYKELIQLNNLFSNISNGKINSYNELINSSKNLSENQKLVLLNSVSNLLYELGYDKDYNGDGLSEEEFFWALQNYLDSGEETSLGRCGDISTLTEIYGEDIGIKIESVSGVSKNLIAHMYNIADLKDRTAIIDSNKLFIVPTENIERALESYQRFLGTVVFQHHFYDKGELKYELITRDGKNYLDFIEYDKSLSMSKDFLLNRERPKQSDLEFNFNLKNYLNSWDYNCYGFFFKKGTLIGSKDSSLKEMNLNQAGFKKYFDGEYFDAYLQSSIILGDIAFENQDKSRDKKVFGGCFDLALIAGFDALNFSLKTKNSQLKFKKEDDLAYPFFDVEFEEGISFGIPINKDIHLEPYSLIQFNYLKKRVRTFQEVPMISNIQAGTLFKVNPVFSLDVYFLNELGDIFGCGGKLELNTGKVKTSVGGYWKTSEYDFCPDNSWRFNLSSAINSDRLSLGLEYEINRKDYDGEWSTDYSFNLNAGIKF